MVNRYKVTVYIDAPARPDADIQKAVEAALTGRFGKPYAAEIEHSRLNVPDAETDCPPSNVVYAEH